MAAVMGWPVMHSLSPLMHNAWMEQEGLKGTYVPLAIKPGTLEPALRALHPLGFAGCNLTIPHKLDAMTIVDEVDDGAVAFVPGRTDDSHGFVQHDAQAPRRELHDLVVEGYLSEAINILVEAGRGEIIDADPLRQDTFAGPVAPHVLVFGEKTFEFHFRRSSE